MRKFFVFFCWFAIISADIFSCATLSPEDNAPAPANLPEMVGKNGDIVSSHGLAISAEGKFLVSVYEETVQLYYLPEGKIGPAYPNYGSTVVVAFSPKDDIFAVNYSSGHVRLFTTSGGEAIRTLQGIFTTDVARSLAFSLRGDLIAAGERYGGQIHLWQASSGISQKVWKAHREGVIALAFSPDATMLAAAGNDGKVSLWNISDAKQIWAQEASGHLCSTVVFSPDGSTIAVGSDSVEMFRSSNGALITKIDTQAPIFGLAFSPSGKFLAVAEGGLRGRAHLISVHNKKVCKTYANHGEYAMTAAAFHPSGSYFVTSGLDRLLRFFPVNAAK
jgi:WD40 repeat protein